MTFFNSISVNFHIELDVRAALIIALWQRRIFTVFKKANKIYFLYAAFWHILGNMSLAFCEIFPESSEPMCLVCLSVGGPNLLFPCKHIHRWCPKFKVLQEVSEKFDFQYPDVKNTNIFYYLFTYGADFMSYRF